MAVDLTSKDIDGRGVGWVEQPGIYRPRLRSRLVQLFGTRAAANTVAPAP